MLPMSTEDWHAFLEVLLACVRCPGGELLTHENVLSIFQACFRIGHYQTERSKDMSGTSCLPHLIRGTFT